MNRPEWIALFVRRYVTLTDDIPAIANMKAIDALDGDGPFGESHNLFRDPEEMADELAADEWDDET